MIAPLLSRWRRLLLLFLTLESGSSDEPKLLINEAKDRIVFGSDRIIVKMPRNQNGS